jgi:hypothetical protein
MRAYHERSGPSCQWFVADYAMLIIIPVLMPDAFIAYTTIVSLPAPTNDVADDNNDTRVRPRGVHFMNSGTRLVVSYLNHGVVYVKL